jgi:2-iminobutanoate/2-iminopropanoate deaminase
MKKEIATDKAPAAIGPYSQGIAARGTALYVSGQLPIDSRTGAFPGDSIEAQTRQSLENVKAILEAAGYTMDDVVKSTVLLRDIADFAAMNAVYGTYFKGSCPARAAFQVAALPKGARVEIEVVAVKD